MHQFYMITVNLTVFQLSSDSLSIGSDFGTNKWFISHQSMEMKDKWPTLWKHADFAPIQQSINKSCFISTNADGFEYLVFFAGAKSNVLFFDLKEKSVVSKTAQAANISDGTILSTGPKTLSHFVLKTKNKNTYMHLLKPVANQAFSRNDTKTKFMVICMYSKRGPRKIAMEHRFLHQCKEPFTLQVTGGFATQHSIIMTGPKQVYIVDLQAFDIGNQYKLTVVSYENFLQCKGDYAHGKHIMN